MKGKRKATLKIARSGEKCEEVEGYLLPQVDWWQRPLFVHKDENGQWEVTDAFSGKSLNALTYSTIEAAIWETEERVSRFGRLRTEPVESMAESLKVLNPSPGREDTKQ